MAQSTPLIPVATLDPVTFHFRGATSVNVALHFFDVAGTVIAQALGGSRDVLGEIPVVSYSGTGGDPTPVGELDWRPAVAVASVNIPGGEFVEFDLGAGSGSLKLTPSGGTNPAGGVYYRLSVSGAQVRAQS